MHVDAYSVSIHAHFMQEKMLKLCIPLPAFVALSTASALQGVELSDMIKRRIYAAVHSGKLAPAAGDTKKGGEA